MQRCILGGRGTHVADAVHLAIFHIFLHLLAILQFLCSACRRLLAVFVEQIDNVKTLVFGIAANDVHDEADDG